MVSSDIQKTAYKNYSYEVDLTIERFGNFGAEVKISAGEATSYYWRYT